MSPANTPPAFRGILPEDFAGIFHEVGCNSDILTAQTAFKEVFFKRGPLPRRHFTENVSLNS
jgi:hypothetical protein